MITFERLASIAQTELNRYFNILSSSRTEEEVDSAKASLSKAIASYAKNLKKLISDVDARVVTDHAAIIAYMNDHFNLDPDKCIVSYFKSRNTVRWQFLIYDKEKYWYVSKLDTGVNMDAFKDWANDMFN